MPEEREMSEKDRKPEGPGKPGKRYALAPLFGRGNQAFVSHTPHARHLGIRVVEVGPCRAVLMLPYREELVGDPARGVIFGGAITTLLDHTAGMAVACSMEEIKAVATIDLRVDYLRAAEPGLDLYADVECYKVTRNVAFVRGIAYDRTPDDPFASCLATFMIGANPTPSPLEQYLDRYLEEKGGSQTKGGSE
ncbi:MAG: thioesterase [Candidatus Binatia bacterium]|nr:MAG: thioesterase [Candidatus Binatia bacterium]